MNNVNNDKNDNKPHNARPPQGISPFGALTENERQQNDDAHDKHKQGGIVHRVLDEINEESSLGCSQPTTNATADEKLLVENRQGWCK